MDSRKAVLVHGRHLGTKGWERIVWGEPPGLLGQIPKAILVALEQRADLMIFSTGASERDGKKEGEFARDFAYGRLESLMEFDLFRTSTHTLAHIYSFLVRVSRLEIESKNTREELRNSGRLCLSEGVTEITLVSCPSHLPRIIRDAFAVYADPEFTQLRHRVSAVTSDIPYEDSTPDDVVIIEPPHRGDDVSPRMDRHAARLFKVPVEQRDRFLGEFSDLLARFGA